jgi:hypothetical protein
MEPSSRQLSIALRQPLGRTALLLGGRAGFGTVLWKQAEPSLVAGGSSVPEVLRIHYELRTGLFLGAVFPRTSRVRLRAELGFDFVAWTSHSRINSISSDRNQDQTEPGITFGFHKTPFWALTAMLGVEFGGP